MMKRISSPWSVSHRPFLTSPVFRTGAPTLFGICNSEALIAGSANLYSSTCKILGYVVLIANLRTSSIQHTKLVLCYSDYKSYDRKGADQKVSPYYEKQGLFSKFRCEQKFTMAKIKTTAVFKEYNPHQSFLLPPSLEELIEPTHLVRVVNQVVEAMDVTSLINQYEGGGTSSYHPRMLLKVLLYGYSVKIYTGRRLARALRSDIHFMWLAGWNKPDFRTLNNFRSSKAKEAIEDLFKQMLVFLMETGYIKMENYFSDGSTFSADANKHKMVWKKNAERYQAGAEEVQRAV